MYISHIRILVVFLNHMYITFWPVLDHPFYFKAIENFVRLILQNGFRVVPVHHFFLQSILNFLHNSLWITSPIQLCLIFYFFAQICCICLQNVINRFVSITTWRTLYFLWHIFYFRFNIISPCCIVLCCN